MIIDNELVLIDNKPFTTNMESDVVLAEDTYKPMFLYVSYSGGTETSTSNGVVSLKYADNPEMSSYKNGNSISLSAKGGKGHVCIPLEFRGDKPYIQVKVTSSNFTAQGKVLAAIVADVPVK